MKAIGVLALQGAFACHAAVIERLGHRAILVRGDRDLEGLDGLVLPGGESTVQLKLIDRLDLEDPIRRFAASGKPIVATCAGLILVARTVTGPEQRSFGFLDVSVERNAWGSQIDSFEAESDEGFPLVFIRAPRIRATGTGTEILARWRGEPVLVREKNIVGATFHPELTPDAQVHALAFGYRHAHRDAGILPA